MSNDERRIRRGSTIRVTITDRAALPGVASGDGDGDRRASLAPGDLDETPFLRLRAGEVRFYDLGVRLKDGAYIETPIDAALKAIIGFVPQTHIEYFMDAENSSEIGDPAYWTQLQTKLLGNIVNAEDDFNPFAVTDGAAHVLQIPHKAESFRLLFGGKRLTDKPGGAPEWKTDTEPGGVLKQKARQLTEIEVSESFFYEAFSTAEAFKVTDMPAFDAPAVEFKAALPLRVFLVPSLYSVRKHFVSAGRAYIIEFPANQFGEPQGFGTGVADAVAVNNWFATRLPVLPMAEAADRWPDIGLDGFFAIEYQVGVDIPNGTPKPYAEQPEKRIIDALNAQVARGSARRWNFLTGSVHNADTPQNGVIRDDAPFTVGEARAHADGLIFQYFPSVGITVHAPVEVSMTDFIQPEIWFDSINIIPAGAMVGIVESATKRRFYFWRKEAVNRIRDNGKIYTVRTMEL